MNEFENGTFQVDASALGLKNAEYFARLMLAINDFDSSQSLMEDLDAQCYVRKEITVEQFEGRHLYLMRVQTGHLVEAVNALFAKVQPSEGSDAFSIRPARPAHPVYKFIKAEPKLSAQFDKIIDLATNTESPGRFKDGTESPSNKKLFSLLKEVRNNIAFHYNDEPKAKVTKRAIRAKIEQLKNAAEKNIGFVQFESRTRLRFTIADRLTDMAWSQIYRDSPGGRTELTERIKAHRTELGREIVSFAQEIAIKWLTDNKLKPERVQERRQ